MAVSNSARTAAMASGNPISVTLSVSIQSHLRYAAGKLISRRGLGSVWTTPQLNHERQAATLLGLPYETTVQRGPIPVAWTIGTDFKPAR
jgi:hypothetical protein